MTIHEIAKRLGISRTRLSQLVCRNKNWLPKHTHIEGRAFIYNDLEIEAWIKTNPMKLAIKNNARPPTIPKMDRALFTDFMSGKYDPLTKKREYQQRKRLATSYMGKRSKTESIQGVF